jgi:mRNA-degrading endonuclease RelE of RelBE toxin-antitoxin system
MSSKHEIIATDNFLHEVKSLSKRHRSLKDDLAGLQSDLLENPQLGDFLGNDAYKVRLAIKSKGKGKSGGGRVITYLVNKNIDLDGNEYFYIFLLSIYDKSDVSTLSDNGISALIKEIRDTFFDEKT